MINVYLYESNDVELTFESIDDLLKFLHEQITKYNCGIYRIWEENNRVFYDVGPRVYSVNSEDVK